MTQEVTQENDKHYWYPVSLSAEDWSDGWVYLTEKEAEIVEYATNPANWSQTDLRPWSGSFSIDRFHKKEKL